MISNKARAMVGGMHHILIFSGSGLSRTKVIEDGGLSTKRVLNKSNQFPRDNCGRGGCVMC